MTSINIQCGRESTEGINGKINFVTKINFITQKYKQLFTRFKAL